MEFSAPDIRIFQEELKNSIEAIKKSKIKSHVAIKTQSLLNITAYVLTTRFLEGSVKHIIFNCCIMRGDNEAFLESLTDRLRGFNNPEFKNIKDIIQECLGYDIIVGKNKGFYSDRDITFLNQIVDNRHKNVHASEDSRTWNSSNQKDLVDLEKEFIGLQNILKFLDTIQWDDNLKGFIP